MSVTDAAVLPLSIAVEVSNGKIAAALAPLLKTVCTCPRLTETGASFTAFPAVAHTEMMHVAAVKGTAPASDCVVDAVIAFWMLSLAKPSPQGGWVY